MNVRDIAYETARQFAEIAASQKWIEARVGDLNLAAKEVTAALKDQQQWFWEALGVAEKKREQRRRAKKKPRKIVKKAKAKKKPK